MGDKGQHEDGEQQVEIWKIKRVRDAVLPLPCGYSGLAIGQAYLPAVCAAHQGFGSSEGQWHVYDQPDHAAQRSGGSSSEDVR